MTGTQVAQTAPHPAAVIRPIRPTDLDMLSDFFAGLSMQSRYQRFFAPVTPGPALLRILSGSAGATVHAVIAITDGGIVGHAMAADRVTPLGGQTTDIGVVVADAWQGRGVGSALMRALITGARARGVTSLTMDVLPDNHRVLAMITGHWPAARIDYARARDSVCLRLPQW
jgi:GNAT superfamily N-acetyltransferase